MTCVRADREGVREAGHRDTLWQGYRNRRYRQPRDRNIEVDGFAKRRIQFRAGLALFRHSLQAELPQRGALRRDRDPACFAKTPVAGELLGDGEARDLAGPFALLQPATRLELEPAACSRKLRPN